MRSGIALPGIISPVVSGNDLLVDGGVLSNLPVDVMRSSYAGIVIGSDVAPVKDLEFDPSMKEFPTLWSVLRQRLNPSNEPPRVPNILQILFRTSVLSAIHHQRVTQGDADVILRPPTDEYGIMQFEAIDEIVDAGYRYASEAIKEWPADLAVAALGDASAMPGCPLTG